MASTKIIKKRIVSIKSTRKIAHTMEMVSTAKSKKQVNKLIQSRPYQNKLEELIENILKTGVSGFKSPYINKVKNIQKKAIIVITADRGLCGAFNSNLLKKALTEIQENKKANIQTDIYAIGKKAISYFKYLNIEVKEFFPNFADSVLYKDVEQFIEPFMQKFKNKIYDEIQVISTFFKSSSVQKVELQTFLPIEILSKNDENVSKNNLTKQKGINSNYLYEPEPKKIIEGLIPLAVKNKFYSFILQSSASEHIARRIAMKNASDAASDMLRNLTREYNRARQASITQELAEIVAGADAL